MIVIDSGLGGLSVVRALKETEPARRVTYLADTGGFPYGSREASSVQARADALIAATMQHESPRLVVLACNTLSTLSLESLRARRPGLSFVGTVPAIKVAGEQSQTRRFTLLATPNTAQSDYTNALIQKFAADCTVDCYGAPSLAQYAERSLLGETVPTELLRAELTPAFLEDTRGRTDMVILGCTHDPLIVRELSQAAPWPVRWCPCLADSESPRARSKANS